MLKKSLSMLCHPVMTREWRMGIKFTPSLQIQMSFLVFSLVSMRRVRVIDSNELSRVTPYCQLCICVAIGNDVEDYICQCQ